MKPALVFVVASAMVSTSAAYAFDTGRMDRAGDIAAGQNKTDVSLIMGAPGNREFKGNQEAWQYCGRSGMANKYIVIYFTYGKVEKLATYSQTWVGNCDDHYKPITWEKPQPQKAKF
ncbi:hypothetical protein MMA231_04174 (plasmid) [Asticcacaulis sp. MM231]|uniref:hypothetical protein n=1 Tax=Asticcacaulis sp. MM231 TaxID=3157666 RepID=UPI0032D59064